MLVVGALRRAHAGGGVYTAAPMPDRSPDEAAGPLRAALVAVQLPGVDDAAFTASVAELGRLGRTLGVDVVEMVTQKRDVARRGDRARHAASSPSCRRSRAAAPADGRR